MRCDFIEWRNTMHKRTGVSANPAPAGPEHGHLFELGKQQTDATLKMQKELLDEYEKASRAWLARMKSEMALYKSDGEPLRSRRTGCLARVRVAAYANGRRRWTAIVRRRSEDDGCHHKIIQRARRTTGLRKSNRNSALPPITI